MSNALLQYSYLQLLDFLTTVAFLTLGVQEGNPMVRLAMQATANPLHGLAALKCLALGLGLYCWQQNKERLLWRVNFGFSLVVAWNMLTMILQSVGKMA